MDIRALTDNYYVAPQLEPADLADIAAAGIKTIICNRPDEEVPANLHATQLELAAQAAGLEFHILPLTHQTMTMDNIAQQMTLASANTPVVAYCATGTRCTVVWALGSAANGMDISEILAAAQGAGYSLDTMRPALEAISKSAD